MKVVLVVPGSLATVSNQGYRRLFPQLLPMSVAYLAAMAEPDGHEVRIIDQVPAGLDNPGLVARLAAFRPDLIGLSVLTTTMANVRDLVARLRRALPATPLLMGNLHASLFAQELLAEGLADLIIRSEGELTLRHLLRTLAGRGRLEEVSGLSFRTPHGRVVHNPDRPLVADLDQLPYPAWHLVDLFNPAYQELPIIGVHSTLLSIMASRGCPFDCLFCSQDKQYRQVRLRRVAAIVDEIEHHVDRYRVKWITFNDAYFPWNREQGMEFADEMIRRGLHRRVKWTTESRVDQVDAHLLRRLAEAGLSVIFFGFESGNQAVLDRAGKRTTLEQARMAARAAREAGIGLMGFFMLGLPGETRQSCWETIRFAIELDCDFAKFALAVPYPGSRFFQELRGQLDASQYEKFTSWYDWCGGDGLPLYAPEGMTVRELVGLQRLGMLRFYARPSLAWRHLRRGTMRPADMAAGARTLAAGAARELSARLRGWLGRQPGQ